MFMYPERERLPDLEQLKYEIIEWIPTRSNGMARLVKASTYFGEMVAIKIARVDSPFIELRDLCVRTRLDRDVVSNRDCASLHNQGNEINNPDRRIVLPLRGQRTQHRRRWPETDSAIGPIG